MVSETDIQIKHCIFYIVKLSNQRKGRATTCLAHDTCLNAAFDAHCSLVSLQKKLDACVNLQQWWKEQQSDSLYVLFKLALAYILATLWHAWMRLIEKKERGYVGQKTRHNWLPVLLILPRPAYSVSERDWPHSKYLCVEWASGAAQGSGQNKNSYSEVGQPRL